MAGSTRRPTSPRSSCCWPAGQWACCRPTTRSSTRSGSIYDRRPGRPRHPPLPRRRRRRAPDVRRSCVEYLLEPASSPTRTSQRLVLEPDVANAKSARAAAAPRRRARPGGGDPGAPAGPARRRPPSSRVRVRVLPQPAATPSSTPRAPACRRSSGPRATPPRACVRRAPRSPGRPAQECRRTVSRHGARPSGPSAGRSSCRSRWLFRWRSTCATAPVSGGP